MLRNTSLNVTNVSSLYFCSFKKKKRFLWDTKEQQTEQKHSRGCWRHEGYCSHFVMFLIFLSQLNYVQVFSILHRAAVTELKMTRRGLKCHKEKKKSKKTGGKRKKKTKTKHGKHKQEEKGSHYQPLWEQTEENLCIQLFSIYLEREVADEKCFRGRQTFFWSS